MPGCVLEMSLMRILNRVFNGVGAYRSAHGVSKSLLTFAPPPPTWHTPLQALGDFRAVSAPSGRGQEAPSQQLKPRPLQQQCEIGCCGGILSCSFLPPSTPLGILYFQNAGFHLGKSLGRIPPYPSGVFLHGSTSMDLIQRQWLLAFKDVTI